MGIATPFEETAITNNQTLKMPLDKIKPNDPRVQSQFAQLNGRRWHYLDARPQGEVKGTCILIHGFPDLSLAWKYQIPMLLNQGLRCLALDCMGYGQTGFSPDLKDYTFQTHADAIAELARQQGIPSIILGGHDWGGAVVYRVAQFYPDLVSHVFSVATPFFSRDAGVSVRGGVGGGWVGCFWVSAAVGEFGVPG